MHAPPEADDPRCSELLLGTGLGIALQPVRALAEPKIRREGWFEVLARPRGFSSPVPVVQWAASAGRALDFDLAVVRLGLAWLSRHPEVGLLGFNLAPETVASADAGRRLLALIERAAIDPARVAVEITEAAPIHDLAYARALTALLRGEGLWIGIDDFGAGASHMALLAPLSIDFIKIDRAFAARLPGADAERLFRGITAFGRELALVTVAEGVETSEQRELLRGLGIDYVQGFHDGGEPQMVDGADTAARAEVSSTVVRVAAGGRP
jgi:EAL domain-containing protein (putative c-di-GMP-specific phosphodiesterase class I)